MYRFSLKDFRGFHDSIPVDIRPITLLIGENSAGKSSFLAALKFFLDLSSGEEASFNKDPFQLGTFQQIAHVRGGRSGRAKSFRIQCSANVVPRRKEKIDNSHVSLSLVFESFESQAAVIAIELSCEGDTLRFSVGSEKNSFDFISRNKETVKIMDDRRIPKISRGELGRYWRFILSDISFRLRGSLGHLGSKEESKIPAHVEERINELGRLAEAMMHQMSGSIEATSAIRTKPLRTYTPGLDAKDGEGSHVPFEMAKLYRSNKDSWRSLRHSLEEYGQASDMFKEISIKSFGSTASDPFQLQFLSDGPKMNIVDLGYGTSQVLPILYNVSRGTSSGRYLIQQPEVHLHPRAQAALGTFFVDAFRQQKKQFVLETHSDFIVDRVRQSIASGLISRSDVSILFFERLRLENVVTQIELDNRGDPTDPPISYRNFFLAEELRALGVS